MSDEIKANWYKLKIDYEKRYKQQILTDFEKSKEYLEKMESYLLEMQQENPEDVDVMCTLSSVKLELGGEEEEYIKISERFLERYQDILDDRQKARIYTNIAFCDDYSEKSLEYLIKAEQLKSPFPETYTALGLFYFSKYEFSQDEKYVSISRDYFKIVTDLDKSYKCYMNYAVSLYELKEYEKAKEIFTDLLKKHPDRMWLKLCIAYCEVNLGNKSSAMLYLAQLKPGQDDNYNLNTDYISEYQLFDVYYVFEEYDKYLLYCSEEVDNDYYTANWDSLFYVLWLKNKKERFARLEEKNRTYFEEAVKEAIEDDDYESEDEKLQTVADWQESKREFESMISSIKSGIQRPEVRLKLYPEYGCFMVDCIRHKLGVI